MYLLIEVTVAESLWRETGPALTALAEAVHAYIATGIAAISQFAGTEAALVTTIVS